MDGSVSTKQSDPNPNASLLSVPRARERRLAETQAFAAFYQAYPRKKKRPDALKAWGQMGCEAIAAEVMVGLARQLPELRGRSPDKVPYPASWLRDEEWKDPAIGARTTKDDRNGDLLEDFMARGVG